MAAAASSSSEPQHEPAPVDAAAATPTSSDQQTTTSETGELLGRVASEISQAFQSSLVQVVSNIGREYGVEPGVQGKFAWMEKGGAAVALAGVVHATLNPKRG